jgi:HemY protein
VRPVLFFVILAVLAVAAAIGLRVDPGNVVLFYPPYRIDLSLNLFIILGVLLFTTLYVLVRLARKTLGMPERVAEYRSRQAERRGTRALRLSLLALFEGRYGQAERHAQGAHEWPETAGLGALLAARAAHRMHEYSRRDEWLKRADESDGLRAARLMTEAECLVDERDSARALDAVNRLQAGGARHIQALRLALRANQYAGQWDEVLRLLRILTKRDALHPTAARQIKVVAYQAMLQARHTDRYALIAFWQDVPTADRRVSDIALAAARAFNQVGLGYQARTILEGALGERWEPELVDAYGECVEEPATAQIERAERWLSEHPNDAHLSHALGVLCARARLWGKARRYFDRALSDTGDEPFTGRIHLGIAQMEEQLGESDNAARSYRLAALASFKS